MKFADALSFLKDGAWFQKKTNFSHIGINLLTWTVNLGLHVALRLFRKKLSLYKRLDSISGG